MKRNPRLIVALDTDTLEKARGYVDVLSPQVGIFKVGFQLFCACGPQVVRMIQEKGKDVFLDLKFHDIPNTVAAAVRQAVRLRVFMLTLHSCGGPEMLRAAVQAANEEAALCQIRRPLLIGVTVLTSQEARAAEVESLAKQGVDAGLDGVVASVREAAELRQAINRDFVIVTPGIRLAEAKADDQKRVASPQEAVRSGSDFLVVGRPIIDAADPCSAASAVLRAINPEGDNDVRTNKRSY